MDTIIKILMDRDGLAEDEARQQVEEIRDQCLDDLHSSEDILADELGLEPDFLPDLLGLY